VCKLTEVMESLGSGANMYFMTELRADTCCYTCYTCYTCHTCHNIADIVSLYVGHLEAERLSRSPLRTTATPNTASFRTTMAIRMHHSGYSQRRPSRLQRIGDRTCFP
jgi:hypothetical protein